VRRCAALERARHEWNGNLGTDSWIWRRGGPSKASARDRRCAAYVRVLRVLVFRGGVSGDIVTINRTRLCRRSVLLG
jgi:hypothetical protein